MSKTDEEELPEGEGCHDLFLPEAKDDRPLAPSQIGLMTLKRLAPWEENARHGFSAEELPNAAAIEEKFGGGIYLVVARDPRGLIIRGGTRRINLGGAKPWPMNAARAEEARNLERAQQTAGAALPPQAGADPTLTVIMGMFKEMNTEARASGERIAASQAESTKAVMGVLTSVLSARPVAGAVVATGDEEKSVDHFRAGMEFAFDALSKQSELVNDAKSGAPDSTIKDVLEGVKALAELSGKGHGPPSQALPGVNK